MRWMTAGCCRKQRGSAAPSSGHVWASQQQKTWRRPCCDCSLSRFLSVGSVNLFKRWAFVRRSVTREKKVTYRFTCKIPRDVGCLKYNYWPQHWATITLITKPKWSSICLLAPSCKVMSRLAVVCGGSRGVGRAVSRLLAERGCRLVVVSRREEAARAAVAELHGGKVLKFTYKHLKLGSFVSFHIHFFSWQTVTKGLH